jgi:two-component sensor histidine kinase
VDFKRTDDGWRLEIADEARGLPEGFDIDRSSGFGMQVVKAFVRRLNAKLTVSSRPGHTTFSINRVQC